jgi:hypothetical protein
MRHYPYFMMDFILLIVLLVIVPLGALLMQPPSFATAAVSVLVFALFFKISIEKIQDFRSSAKELKGLDSWESEFMSLGTLIFHFKGEKMSYKSAFRGRQKDLIAVQYELSAQNGSNTEFAIINQESGWLGEFSVFGDSAFPESMKKEIASFNSKYRVMSLANCDGKLEAVVELCFKNAPPPSKDDKLDEMQAFLQEYLVFVLKINQALKKGPKTAPKKTPAKTIRKKRKRKK